jgi:hypothetical protein
MMDSRICSKQRMRSAQAFLNIHGFQYRMNREAQHLPAGNRLAQLTLSDTTGFYPFTESNPKRN